MSDYKKYIPLKEVIHEYIDEARLTQGEYLRLWQIAFRGCEQLLLDVCAQYKTIRIKLNDNKTADIPKDYLKWVKVGVMNGYGEIATLTVNNKLTAYKDLNPNRLTDIASDTGDIGDIVSNPYYYNFYNDGNYEQLFGVPSGLMTAGECNVDEDNGVIVLDPNFGYDYVMLMYSYAPEKDDDYTIPFECREALIAWLYYRDNRGRRSVSEGQVKSMERDWINAKKLARKRIKPFRLQEAEQVIREGAKLVVKA